MTSWGKKKEMGEKNEKGKEKSISCYINWVTTSWTYSILLYSLKNSTLGTKLD